MKDHVPLFVARTISADLGIDYILGLALARLSLPRALFHVLRFLLTAVYAVDNAR